MGLEGSQLSHVPVVGLLASHLEVTVTVCHQAERSRGSEGAPIGLPEMCVGKVGLGSCPGESAVACKAGATGGWGSAASSGLNSGCLVGSNAAALVDIEWPVVRLREERGVVRIAKWSENPLNPTPSLDSEAACKIYLSCYQEMASGSMTNGSKF